MSKAVIALLALALIAIAACGGGDAGAPPEPRRETEKGPAFGRATAVIDTRHGTVEIDVEVAETAAQRKFGLMYRRSLPREAGMVFLFGKETRGGFWMKNTLIPLSIAFFGPDGKILRILRMEPCRIDPCPLYDPGVVYFGALEVNQGAFREWRVAPGDVITVRR